MWSKRSSRWSMEPKRSPHRCLMVAVLMVGAVYFLYILYYSSMRFKENSWNARPAKDIDHLYNTDPHLKSVHEYMSTKGVNFPADVTMVTAYFNLGKLNKGKSFKLFGGYTPEKYKRWMSVFGRIDNPLIVFTDSEDIVKIFTKLRAGFPAERTQIVYVNRTELWSFSLAPQIKKIYAQPGYPNYDPNTVNEFYSCTMHAKFELVNKVIKDKMFKTKYVSWLDIGLFRDVINEKHNFPIRIPPGFDDQKVAYSEQNRFEKHLTPFEVIYEDRIWVGGAMFMGRPEVLYVYTQDYMNSVLELISLDMMSTDQQVIYIMYQETFAYKPRVEIQTFTTHSGDDWFYLGYTIKDMFDHHIRKTVSMIRFLQSLL